MKKTILATLFVSVLTFIVVLHVRETNSSTIGAPAGNTGSPGDGESCNTSCHADLAVISQPGWISSTIPDSGYTPDSTYSITATVTKTGTTKFGFQLSPQNAGGTLLGTLVANATTQLNGSGKYINHVASSTAGTDSASWTFGWIAPPAGTGNVTFYAAFNASNNDGFGSGDQIYTSTLTVKDTTPVGIEESQNIYTQIKVFPNPSNGKFIINLNTKYPVPSPEIIIYNIVGERIFQTSNSLPLSNDGVKHQISNVEIDISEEESSIYFLQVISGDGIQYLPVVISK